MTISPVVQAHNTNILPVVSAPEGAQDLWLLPTLEDRVLSAFVPHRSRVCRSRTAAALDASVTSSSSSSSSSSSALQTRMHSTIINKYFIDKWSKNSDEMPHRQRVTPHGCKWIRPMVDLSNTWFLVKATHVGQLPKRHLIRFSCFSRAHPSLKPTKQYALQWFWMGRTTPITAVFHREYRPPSNTWLLGPTSISSPKRNLDRFSRFCRVYERDQQTDKQTHRQTVYGAPSVATSNSSHLIQCVRCGL